MLLDWMGRLPVIQAWEKEEKCLSIPNDIFLKGKICGRFLYLVSYMRISYLSLTSGALSKGVKCFIYNKSRMSKGNMSKDYIRFVEDMIIIP